MSLQRERELPEQQQIEQIGLRPYELPTVKYGLWYEVGQKFSPLTQACVLLGLVDNHHRIPATIIEPSVQKEIAAMARRRNIFVQFLR